MTTTTIEQLAARDLPGGIRYLQHYGSRCRDCADEGGFCPSTGIGCGESEKAIKHILAAINYGAKHGYLTAGQLAALLPEIIPTNPRNPQTQTDLLARLEELAGKITPGPWQGYSEPEVNLPYSLFAGVLGQTGFGPVEPLSGYEIDFIALVRNALPELLALATENARMWEALEKIRKEKPMALPFEDCEHRMSRHIQWAQDIARAALSTDEGEG